MAPLANESEDRNKIRPSKGDTVVCVQARSGGLGHTNIIRIVPSEDNLGLAKYLVLFVCLSNTPAANWQWPVRFGVARSGDKLSYAIRHLPTASRTG